MCYLTCIKRSGSFCYSRKFTCSITYKTCKIIVLLAFRSAKLGANASKA